jgi:1-deoxy-D-xylulose-5-phosphate synthase
MATRGILPVCVIYSTFLQRAYDNVIHDVAIQHLPVVFAMDRAGLVGEDGPTHMGLYDIAYMLAVPGMTVTAPKNGTEMLGLLRTGAAHAAGPFSIRYPRDAAPDIVPPMSEIEAVPYGTWETLRKGAGARDANGGIAILATGTMVLPSLAAADMLAEEGLNVTVVNCRFIKPHDADALSAIVSENRYLLTVEEGTVVNGFGARMAAVVSDLAPSVQVHAHGVPDEFIEQAPRAKQLASVGLDAAGIAARVRQLRGSDSRGARLRAG